MRFPRKERLSRMKKIIIKKNSELECKSSIKM